MKKSVFVILLFATVTVICFAFVTKDEPKFKNLKILKEDISEKELDSVMHFFAISLGEKCTFCHVRNEAENKMDFPSDANPNKDVARYMIRMANKINKKYFKDQEKNSTQTVKAVTCYTCHHGEAMPLAKARPMPKVNMGGGNKDFHADSSKNLSGDTTRAPH